MQRPESKIEQLLTVERETRAGFQRRRMPGIGGRRHEPGFQPSRCSIRPCPTRSSLAARHSLKSRCWPLRRSGLRLGWYVSRWCFRRLARRPRFGRYRRSHVSVQRDRFLIQANNGLDWIIGLLVDGQHVFHLLDVRLVQLGYAPHFFPATASSRGSVAKSGLSLGPRWVPTCA